MKPLNTIKKIKYLCPADKVNLIFIILLSLILLVFSSGIPGWYLILILNISLLFALPYLVAGYESLPENIKTELRDRFSLLKTSRFFYPVPMILISFKEVHYIIISLRIADSDPVLVNIDRWLFGTDPTQWAFRFENQFLTEFLQLVYLLYYFIILIYGMELFLWKRYEEMKYAVFMVFTGFYVSYVFYMLFPAAGPRFYLHDFNAVNQELPGILFTKWIRIFLDFGESIPPGVANPLDYAQRDAMPSAHTTLALIIAYLSWKFNSKSFRFYFPYCFLMMISTIYLRYHYVIDIIAGAVLFPVILLITRIVYKEKTFRRSL